MKLLGLGDNVVDCYLHSNMMYPGGNALNTAVFAQRFGVPAAYMGYVGTDRAGNQILTALKSENIDIQRVTQRPGPSWHCKVEVLDGERFFLGSDRGVYKDFAICDGDWEYIRSFDLIHTSVFSQVEPYLPQLAALPGLVSFDYSTHYNQELLSATAPYVDIALFSGDNLTKDDIPEFMDHIGRFGPKTVLVTMGSAGAVAWQEGSTVFQPAFYVEPIDTMGSGDCFLAGFLTRFLQNKTIPECLQYGAETAAANCLIQGSFGYGITMEEVDRG